MADLDHVVMRVEMHAVAGARALDAGDEVPARIGLAVAGRAMGADQFGREAAFGEIGGEKIADLAVIAPRRVQRRNAYQCLRQRDQIIAARVDGGFQASGEVHTQG